MRDASDLQCRTIRSAYLLDYGNEQQWVLPMTLESKLEALVAELKPLLEKATPRPWKVTDVTIPDGEGDKNAWEIIDELHGLKPMNSTWGDVDERYRANGELIVAAVNAVSRLEALLAERQEPGRAEEKEPR